MYVFSANCGSMESIVVLCSSARSRSAQKEMPSLPCCPPEGPVPWGPSQPHQVPGGSPSEAGGPL